MIGHVCIVRMFGLVLEDMSKDEPWFKVKIGIGFVQ